MYPWDSILELLDLRSFSNLWFWMVLGGLWIVVSHWVLGVPYGLVLTAQRDGGEAEDDLRDLLGLRVKALLRMGETAGVLSVGMISFFLTMLALLGFVYWVEFAQAVFLLLLPLVPVLLLSLRTARKLAHEQPEAETIYLRLRRLRTAVQAIGLIAVLITTTWGMYVNASLGVMGH
ncbi:component of SufBCD complex [Pseudooceanicola algae]|uniref:Component of SufBCD complex n=1 Tax=Pseudooceanicola algae TaxID=1537215 RepID=A0A418SEA3_9RHOB|nr:component of SufBCD complex [Pseudooceanicola algae]QPM89627.1 hypothetical protein PSAL_008490 [Pseudooceanicola algae]